MCSKMNEARKRELLEWLVDYLVREREQSLQGDIAQIWPLICE